MDTMVRTFQYSAYLSPSYWSDKDDDAYTIAETVMSPAKYALFQLLGYHFIQNTFLVDAHPSLSPAMSVKVGASGGAAFALLHLSLLLLRRNCLNQASLADDEPNSKYALLLCKEVVYSAAASVIGALVSGLRDHQSLSSLTIAGLSGPMIFLAILFGMLALVIGIVWVVERLKDWWWRMRYL